MFSRKCCDRPKIRTSREFIAQEIRPPGKVSPSSKNMDSVVVRVEGIATASAGDAAAVADLLCSLDGVQKSDFDVSSVDNKGETVTARISCSGVDVAEAVVQKISGKLTVNCCRQLL